MFIVVDDNDSGIRLDVFVHRQLGDDASRNDAQTMIKLGLVSVDGANVMKPSTRVPAGSSIEIIQQQSPEIPTQALTPQPIEFGVVYEDEHLLVIDKPIGLAVHPGAGRKDGTLVNGLIRRWPEISDIGENDRPGIVHRLDMDTSGLMVVARTDIAFATLQQQIKNREVGRTYTALVRGIPEPSKGVVDAPIGRDPNNRLKQAIVADGREARTQYEVVEEISTYALLKIKLETGRMHQIRVHMAALGTPVVGDQRYGKSSDNLDLNRQFLHASRLEFAHPMTKQSLQFSSPLPHDLSQALEKART